MFLHLHSTKNYTQTCRPAVHNCYDWGRPVGGGVGLLGVDIFLGSWRAVQVVSHPFHSAPDTRPLGALSRSLALSLSRALFLYWFLARTFSLSLSNIHRYRHNTTRSFLRKKKSHLHVTHYSRFTRLHGYRLVCNRVPPHIISNI